MVSIITPLYNSEQYISQTVESVINQTYKDWELILIDDASTDDTLSIIKPFLDKNSKIKLLKNKKNLGAAISRNKAINEAQGDYIAFLDADDLWKSKKLQTQIEAMQLENADICFSSYDQIDESGAPLNKKVKALPLLTYKKLLKSNYVGNLTGIYNSRVLGKIQTPNLRKRQDWLLWLEAIKRSKKAAIGIQESLAYYRIRKDSMSSNKFNLLKHNYWVYKKGLEYSTAKSFYRMAIFLAEHFFVKQKQVVNLDVK